MLPQTIDTLTFPSIDVDGYFSRFAVEYDLNAAIGALISYSIGTNMKLNVDKYEKSHAKITTTTHEHREQEKRKQNENERTRNIDQNKLEK